MLSKKSQYIFVGLFFTGVLLLMVGIIARLRLSLAGVVLMFVAIDYIFLASYQATRQRKYVWYVICSILFFALILFVSLFGAKHLGYSGLGALIAGAASILYLMSKTLGNKFAKKGKLK